MTSHTNAAYARLRRLQEQNRSNIPALIAERAMSSFTLHEEPEPESLSHDVRVMVYPQDPFVGQPEVRQMNARDLQPGLVNSRVRLQDSAGAPAQPDADGHYLYWPGSREFDQVNVFYYATFTLRMYERFAHRALPWSFPSPRVSVDPHVGEGANAFYNEPERLIGFYSFRLNGTEFNAAHSADVISHETAHAVLDGLRDLYNESFGLGPTAFHESFGDMTAVLVALHDDSLVKRLLDWTNGDLHIDSFITNVAEHLSQGARESQTYHSAYLRNALNKLMSIPFDDLAYAPSDPTLELGRESHNYSRLFTGAFYDLLVEIYDHLKGEMQPLLAVHRARDVVGYLLVLAVELAPVSEMDFSDMARAFITADDILNDGHYTDLLVRVFAERGILPSSAAEAHRLSLRALPDIHLPESINSALGAALFLEEQVAAALHLPADLELTPIGAYRNALGHAFVTYLSHRRIVLEGAQYRQFAGLHADAFGGLTLMFDADNRLRSACLRLVTDEDVRQIGVMITELVTHGLIADPTVAFDLVSSAPLHMLPGAPEAMRVNESVVGVPMLTEDRRGDTKLVKFPVIFDVIPRHVSNFLSYLLAWRDRDK